jgi:hypothetical protein
LSDFTQKALNYWAVDHQGTTAATATKAAVTGRKHVVTGISGSSSGGAGSVELYDGTTLIWKGRFVSGAAYAMSFAPGTLVGTSGAKVEVIVSGTTATEANIAGFTILG